MPWALLGNRWFGCYASLARNLHDSFMMAALT